jgi:hypothetical protein
MGAGLPQPALREGWPGMLPPCPPCDAPPVAPVPPEPLAPAAPPVPTTPPPAPAALPPPVPPLPMVLRPPVPTVLVPPLPTVVLPPTPAPAVPPPVPLAMPPLLPVPPPPTLDPPPPDGVFVPFPPDSPELQAQSTGNAKRRRYFVVMVLFEPLHFNRRQGTPQSRGARKLSAPFSGFIVHQAKYSKPTEDFADAPCRPHAFLSRLRDCAVLAGLGLLACDVGTSGRARDAGAIIVDGSERETDAGGAGGGSTGSAGTSAGGSGGRGASPI